MSDQDKLKGDLEAISRVISLIGNATISGKDAPIVSALINYLEHIEASLEKGLVDEKA